ncbi:MAG TPA: tRNA (adenosine(37)-N6)-dimethylallyltransferase MiaA [Actinomycetota bacterium]
MRTARAARAAAATAADLSIPRALVGPTASGKTEASIELARRLDAEVILVDSMTVYRGMDVGTAKPGPDERARIPHHLADVADPTESFSVARFQALAREAVREIAARGRVPLLVGGSGLYFRAAVDDLEFPGTDPGLRGLLNREAGLLGPEWMHARLADLDPDAAAKIDPENVRRSVRALEVAALTGRPFSSFAAAWERYPEGRVVAAGLRAASDVLVARIEVRVEAMLEGGLVDEVRVLLDRGFGPFLTSSQAIGYLEVVRHLEGRLSLEEAAAEIARRTRALARRQMAWFRRDPRIRWFDVDRGGPPMDEIEDHLRGAAPGRER